jgi:hypothetical protein
MTAPEFPVALTSVGLPVADARPVVFHGVNKSGSLAMANVIRASYEAAGRGNQFFCTYHGLPRSLSEFEAALSAHSGHGFFVSHYIYGRMHVPASGLLVSQVRHPLSRTLSVYGWLKRNHLKKEGALDGFRPFDDWLSATKGKSHTQMSQFAAGFGPDRSARIRAMEPEEMCEIAVQSLERDFAWFGIAELFEESIFAMAHICGLPRVLAWHKDTRNKWRQSLAETDVSVIDQIRETMRYEFEFYERALGIFRERIAEVGFGSSLGAYRDRCSNEYGDRLVGT